MKAIYLHPDGMGELLFDAAISRLFFFNDAEGQSGYVLIGPAGLREVAQKLLAMAEEAEMGGARLPHPANGPADKSAPHPGYGPDDIQF
jgi:hypothetical protein